MIKVNDKPVEYEEGMTVTDVIKKCNFMFPLLIVKIDGVYVTRDTYNTTPVPDACEMDIIHLISGG
ncbi:MAG: sulfur carrier protein ThiS [Candidatus Riflebacteria bacterium]|nr:sulfur carrier protein ThiS [Candidatus Riflebacteria bacterium]